MTKLAIFFDGTWNTPADRTNVYKLYKIMNDIDNSKQRATYIQGVGTEKGGLLSSCEHFLGGAFGDGLSENILQGYKWLIECYHENDAIFIFGFSRGAYTARSLAGLTRSCGILKQENAEKINEAYEMYRDKLDPDSPEAKNFRNQFSFEPDITFVGVWDTVGSLGIPVNGLRLPGFHDYYNFHDTKLSRKVLAAYHALAINEFRSPYSPTLWTKQDDPKAARPANLPVEQRWFIGAHSNVGGGYTGDVLCNIPCRWIQKLAQRHGLEFFADWPVGDNDYNAQPRDSYEEFVTEHPDARAFLQRTPRAVYDPAALGETVDPSVIKRLNEDASFLRADPELKEALLKLPPGV